MILIVEIFFILSLLFTHLLIVIFNFWLYDNFLLFIASHPPVEPWLFAKQLKEVLSFFLSQLAHFIINVCISPTLRLLIHFKVTIDHEIDCVFEAKYVSLPWILLIKQTFILLTKELFVLLFLTR